ncbi:hypothetical protein ACQ3VF_19305 [Bacillus toyonensis]
MSENLLDFFQEKNFKGLLENDKKIMNDERKFIRYVEGPVRD